MQIKERPWLLTGILTTAGFASCLVGCRVGPKYTSPTADLAPFHNANADTSQSAARAPPLDVWWIGFNDPVLTRIVQRTLEQNLTLTASAARVEQARAAARGAGARLRPQGDLNTQAAPLHQSLKSPLGAIASHLPGYDRNQTLYDFGAEASWEIDIAGGLHRGAEAAAAEAQAAEAEHLGVRVSVAAEAADAYLQSRGDQERIRVTKDQISTDARLLQIVRQRLTYGISTDRELAQAESLLAQARGAAPPLRAALEAQLNRLDVLMGAQPGTYATELTDVTTISTVPPLPATLTPAQMLRRRPDVIAAERQVAAANALIGVAIAEYYPKVSLSGLLGFESLSSSNFFTSAAFQPEAAAGLRWRLFDFGRVDAQVAQANGMRAAALAQYRQAVLRAAQDVEDAFSSLVQLEAQEHEIVHEVNSLQRARDRSLEAYEAGAAPLTDVLDSDRQLLSARDRLVVARTDSARAAVAAFRAFGGGW
jgi:NodT family efflux transporter outer membrane factor (OMF) lipoprotein